MPRRPVRSQGRHDIRLDIRCRLFLGCDRFIESVRGDAERISGHHLQYQRGTDLAAFVIRVQLCHLLVPRASCRVRRTARVYIAKQRSFHRGIPRFHRGRVHAKIRQLHQYHPHVALGKVAQSSSLRQFLPMPPLLFPKQPPAERYCQ